MKKEQCPGMVKITPFVHPVAVSWENANTSCVITDLVTDVKTEEGVSKQDLKHECPK